MPETRIIYGPPGTGKTTKLLTIIEDELQHVSPDRVAFVSFTRKAAGEALDRARDQFDFNARDLPYFRTLHSLAYRQLGMQRDGVMGRKHYRELGGILGVEFTGNAATMEDGIAGGSGDGDKCLFIEQLARNRCLTLQEQWEQTGGNIQREALIYVVKGLQAYKKDRGLYDFTDMLEEALTLNPLDIDVAIVDEAQDLSALQWKVVHHLFSGAQRMYVAGDDDQAIYQWSGADVEQFINLDGAKEVLANTYRLPRAIYNVAEHITQRMGGRVAKQWAPRNEGGTVEHHVYPDKVKLDGGGSWLLLARNRYLLKGLVDHARASGVLYSTRYGNSVDVAHVAAMLTWARLKDGHDCTVAAIKQVYDIMGMGTAVFGKQLDNTRMGIEVLTRSFGLTTRALWYKCFMRIPEATREYYADMLVRGIDITEAPMVHIDTIHGVKGGEADNVMLLTDMAWNTWEGYRAEPDAEHRVFFVGATRARHALHIVQGQTNMFYPL